MRNLKKILSLALALVMVFSLMTFASAKDFNDAGDIEHTEAVEVLTALEVIDGVGNNTFNPTGKVTRAQMAKMITLISLGNVSVDAFLGTTTDLTDINGHWAEAYIKYCYSQGIISGKGNGRFDPDNYVTTAEASKMLLVALGYNSDVQVYEGPQWTVNVIRDAQLSGFYDGVALPAETQINRDQAAQMMYNTLNAYIIVKGSEQSREDGSIVDSYSKGNETLLNKAFKGKIFVGTFDGNSNTISSLPTGYVQVTGAIESSYEGMGTGAAVSFPYDFDITRIGEEVKVIFKDGTSGASDRPDRQDTIYGVYVTGATNVVNATMDNVGGLKSAKAELKVSGTTYKAESTVEVIFNFDESDTDSKVDGAALSSAGDANTESLLTAALKKSNSNAIKVVFNSDNEVSKVYVTEYALGKVTSVTSDKISISGVGAFDIEGNDIYSGVAKDDVVVYTRFYDESDLDDAYFTVTLAETVEGTLTAYDATAAANEQKKASIDGTSYKIANTTLAANLTDDAIINLVSHNGVGKAVKAYMVNGMIGALQAVEEGTRNYALVIGTNSQPTNTNTMSEGKVRLLLTDGTKVTYVIDEKSTIAQAAEGKLIRYNVKSGNTLDILQVYSTSSSTTAIWNNDTKQVAASGVAASNSVLFVKTNSLDNDSWKVYNVRDLKSVTAAGAKTVTYATNSSGQIVAAAVDLNATPAGDGSTRYGLVTAQNGITKIDDTNYSQYTIWTGEESVTVYIEGTNRAELAEKHLYKFDLTNDRKYSNSDGFSELTHNGSTIIDVAVKEYNESDKILSYYTNLEKAGTDWVGDAEALETKAVDDDVQIIYVDADGKKAGAETGVTAFNASTGFKNAKIIIDNSKVIAILVGSNFETDVNGNKNTSGAYWTPVTRYAVTGSATVTAGTTNGYSVTVPADYEVRSGAVATLTVKKTSADKAQAETVTVNYTIGGTAKTATVEFDATNAANTTKTVDTEAVTGAVVVTGASAVKKVEPIEATNLAALKDAITSAASAAVDNPVVINMTGDAALDAPMTVPAYTTLNVEGNITGAQNLTISANAEANITGNVEQLVVAGEAAVTGNVTTMSASGTAEVTGTVTTLTVESTGDVTVTGDVTTVAKNEGTLVVQAPAGRAAAGTIGTLTDLAGGEVTAATITTLTATSGTGAKTITGNVGTVANHAGAGTLTITGDVTTEITATAASAGALTVTGDVTKITNMSSDVTVGGEIGTLTEITDGKLTVNGTASVTKDTTLTGGSIEIGAGAILTLSAADNSGALDLSSYTFSWVEAATGAKVTVVADGTNTLAVPADFLFGSDGAALDTSSTPIEANGDYTFDAALNSNAGGFKAAAAE